MKPSYKSKSQPDLNETSRTPTAEDEYHYAKCFLRVRVGERNSFIFLETCPVYFYGNVKENTGGHQHKNPAKPGETMTKHVLHRRGLDKVDYHGPIVFPEPGQPGVRLSKADKNFRVKATYSPRLVKEGFAFKVEASIVGQREDLSACNGIALDDFSNCAFHILHVKYPGLSNFRSTLDKDHGEDYDTMVPEGDTKTHPDNHYGTATFNRVLEATAQKYYNEFYCYEKAEDGSHLGYQAIAVNDMSLEYGGVFDFKNTWQPPHSSPGHAKGLATDIRYRNPKFSTKNNSIIYRKDIRERFEAIFEEIVEEITHGKGETYIEHEFEGEETEHVHIEIR